MEIKKGKLYYNTQEGVLEMPMSDMEVDEGVLTDKIAVHCHTKDDKLYVSKNYSLETIGKSSSNYILINEDDACGKGYDGLMDYHIITIDQFKEFYPPQVDRCVNEKDNMKIKKGDKFLCIKDVTIWFPKGVVYNQGDVYTSEQDGCITNNKGNTYHCWAGVENVWHYFKPLSEVGNIYTDATDRIRDLYEGYQGDKFGDPTKAKFFGVKFSDREILYLSANDEYENPFFNRDYVTEDTFIELTGLSVNHVFEQDEYSWVNNGLQDVTVKKTFNPQPYYDNSKGSLYKVATERGWNAYLFDLVKRLERGGKKDPLKQEIEKSIDVLKIWLNEID